MMVIILAPVWVDFSAEKLLNFLGKNGIQVITELSACKEIDGEKLHLAYIESSVAHVLEITNADMTGAEGEYLAMDLGIKILATESEPIDQKLLLPFFRDQVVGYDENSEPIFAPVTDVTGLVPVLAGKAWLY